MDCTSVRRLFPALMSGDLPAAESAQAEEHLVSCEECSREFEAYESRFYREYEPAGKALASAARLPLPEPALEKFAAELKARLNGACAKLGSAFPALATGEPAGAAREELESHVQACEACSRQFEAYETKIFREYEVAGKALATAAAILPPEGALVGFWQKVQARIAADRRGGGVRRAAWALNAAALLIIAVSVGYLANGAAKAPAAGPGPDTNASADIRPGPGPLPPETGGTGSALPASTGTPAIRSFGVPNRRVEEFRLDQRRRPGGLDVIQADGLHVVDEARPMKDGDSVGF